MNNQTILKYPAEFFLEFQSVDRFLHRVSDLYDLGKHVGNALLDRLDKCHLYILAKRPRLSIVPASVVTTDASIRLLVEYRFKGTIHRTRIGVPRNFFATTEVAFEPSPYPHRELLSFDKARRVVAHTLLANIIHLAGEAEDSAKDLEVLYVGKGLRNSARDRLQHHSTLQRILAEVNSNDPDSEVFVLAYSFTYRKNMLAFLGKQAANTGALAKRHREMVMACTPSLEEQIALIEGACIAYFKPTKFNVQYLDFPSRNHKILDPIREADFAGIVVQLDNTNIGGQRLFSEVRKPESTHYVVVDFRKDEGTTSALEMLEGVD